ncbi:ATP-binding cassette domain-containing protein, partial [Fusobacterium mortiferum]|nr:ATP-binding cassette domain-containing protein [Fusobacterium mortiferum]
MLLEAKNINVSFKKENQKTIFGKERQQVIKNVSLSLKKGECLGIIGESGSGKSTLGKTLIGLLKPDSGNIIFDGVDMYNATKEEKRKIQQKISIVFQDYTSSANPRFLVKDIIGESLRVLERKLGKKIDKVSKIKELLETVGLNEGFMNRYPHE